MRKKLSICYYVRGFHGCTRVDEGPQNHLSTDIVLGYPDGGEDPFAEAKEKNANQLAIARIQNLRLVDSSGKSTEREVSEYAHLGRAW